MYILVFLIYCAHTIVAPLVLLLLVAFACCLAAALVTDNAEGEFVALMFTIQLAAFLLLPVAVSISYCISNYIR